MSEDDPRIRRLLERRRRIAEQFPDLEKLLRGTLRQRYVRCGKPGCHCREGRGHGPVRYLSVSLGVGRTQQITIAPEDFETARRYVKNYERLWKLLERISAINRELLKRRGMPRGSTTRTGRRRSRKGDDPER